MANRPRLNYPADRERVQVNLALPVDLKRAVIASALGQGHPMRDEAEQLLRLGLAARHQAVTA